MNGQDWTGQDWANHTIASLKAAGFTFATPLGTNAWVDERNENVRIFLLMRKAGANDVTLR